MSTAEQQAAEHAARAYEDLLVPALFTQWSEPILDAAAVKRGDDVLDVACGTGALTRAAARRTGTGGRVHGLDLNPAMLDVAREQAPEIEWHQGSADALPFEDASFDAVVSQFGLMLFPDPVPAVREMLRVLAPGGRMAVAVFDGLDGNQGYEAIVSSYERVVGAETAAALRAPFSMGDPDGLIDTFARAGAPAPAVQTHHAEARFNDARHVVLADVRGWFPIAGIQLDDATIDEVTHEVREALSDHIAADGSIEFPMSARVVVVDTA